MTCKRILVLSALTLGSPVFMDGKCDLTVVYCIFSGPLKLNPGKGVKHVGNNILKLSQLLLDGLLL